MNYYSERSNSKTFFHSWQRNALHQLSSLRRSTPCCFSSQMGFLIDGAGMSVPEKDSTVLPHSQSTLKMCIFWIVLQGHWSPCIYFSQIYKNILLFFQSLKLFSANIFFIIIFIKLVLCLLFQNTSSIMFSSFEHNFHLLKGIFLPLFTIFY